jgi:hypothetical protein
MLYKSNLIIFYYYLTIKKHRFIISPSFYRKFKFIIKKVPKNDGKKS